MTNRVAFAHKEEYRHVIQIFSTNTWSQIDDIVVPDNRDDRTHRFTLAGVHSYAVQVSNNTQSRILLGKVGSINE